jgi:hypothetical protein
VTPFKEDPSDPLPYSGIGSDSDGAAGRAAVIGIGASLSWRPVLLAVCSRSGSRRRRRRNRDLTVCRNRRSSCVLLFPAASELPAAGLLSYYGR